MDKECYKDDCSREVHCLGMCRQHYRMHQYYRTRPEGAIKAKPRVDDKGNRLRCGFRECHRYVESRGFCKTHAAQDRRGEELKPIHEMDDCPVEFCDKKKSVRVPLCKRCAQLKWRYSLTFEEAIEFGKLENRRCSNPGCLSEENLHLDHDHSCCPPGTFTGHKMACGKCVRGWLCFGCNRALGSVQDSPEKLLGLVQFLARV